MNLIKIVSILVIVIVILALICVFGIFFVFFTIIKIMKYSFIFLLLVKMNFCNLKSSNFPSINLIVFPIFIIFKWFFQSSKNSIFFNFFSFSKKILNLNFFFNFLFTTINYYIIIITMIFYSKNITTFTNYHFSVFYSKNLKIQFFSNKIIPFPNNQIKFI